MASGAWFLRVIGLGLMRDCPSRNRVLLQLKSLEIEKARIEKWDGRYPQWWMAGNTAGGPNLLMQAPLPGPEQK
jgi:hypothetical protein